MLNKTNILKLFGIGSMCLFLLGCSEESFLMQENTSDVIMEENSEIKITEEQEFLQKEEEIAVHICGAVNQPGVYYLKENQRLYEAVRRYHDPVNRGSI